MIRKEFDDVLDILKENGHEIMMEKYSCFKEMDEEKRNEI